MSTILILFSFTREGKFGRGFNAQTGTYVDMMSEGTPDFVLFCLINLNKIQVFYIQL